jgi:ankyrin repeat protein
MDKKYSNLFLFIFFLSLVACAVTEKNSKETAKSSETVFVQQSFKDDVDINRRDETGQTPLHHACYSGDFETAKALVEKGANVNIEVPESLLTPLHAATMNGDIKIVKYLVANGATINAKDSEGATPLLAACWIGKKDVVYYLAEKGAEINVKTKYGASPLHYSAQSGSIELVTYFVNNGFDINDRAINGATPLHIAVARRDIPIVKFLLKNGANPDVQMKQDAEFAIALNSPVLSNNDIEYIEVYEGQSPLDIAVQNEYDELIDLLME